MWQSEIILLQQKGFLHTPTNGTDWTYKEQKTVFTWSGNVVYGNGKFVTSGTDVFYSSNGSSWTKVDTEYAFSEELIFIFKYSSDEQHLTM